jgi:hypothetical protein
MSEKMKELVRRAREVEDVGVGGRRGLPAERK